MTKKDTGLTPENRAARKGHITASAYPRIKAGGGGARTELIRIARERLNLPAPGIPVNAAMRHGIETEPQAAAVIAANFAEIYARALAQGERKRPYWKPDALLKIKPNDDFIAHACPHWKIGATPDMIADMLHGHGVIIQIKTPYSTKQYREFCKAPPQDHLEQVWFERFVMQQRWQGCQYAILLCYTRSHPRGIDDIAAHLIDDPDDAPGPAQIPETILAAENEIAALIAQISQQNGADIALADMPPADPEVEEVAAAKAQLDAIDEARKALKREIDAAAKRAAKPLAKPLAKELDIINRIAGAAISPPGIRRYTTAAPLNINAAQLPEKYIIREPNMTAIKAALAAGEKIPGVSGGEALPQITILKRRNDAKERQARIAFADEIKARRRNLPEELQ